MKPSLGAIERLLLKKNKIRIFSSRKVLLSTRNDTKKNFQRLLLYTFQTDTQFAVEEKENCPPVSTVRALFYFSALKSPFALLS